jgi:hypothetical protein
MPRAQKVAPVMVQAHATLEEPCTVEGCLGCPIESPVSSDANVQDKETLMSVANTTEENVEAPANNSNEETPAVTPEPETPNTQETDEPKVEATTEEGEKQSKYKARLAALGRDAMGAEIPLQLADMMRAAAFAAGDVAIAAWIRLAWADAVNAANLTHEVTAEDGTVTVEPWKFDKASLDVTTARTSTRGLTEEQKKAKAQEKKVAEKEEKDLVKQLLAEHRAKLAAAKGGSTSASSEAPAAAVRHIPTPPAEYITPSGLLIVRR